MHKIKSSAERFESFVGTLCERLKCEPSTVQLKYLDADGDQLLISDDNSLTEAVDFVRASGDDTLKLVAVFDAADSAAAAKKQGKGAAEGGGLGDKTTLYAAGAVAGALVLVAFLLRPRRATTVHYY